MGLLANLQVPIYTRLSRKTSGVWSLRTAHTVCASHIHTPRTNQKYHAISANVAVRDRVLQVLYVLERQLEPSTERGGRCRILGALDGRHRHS